MGLDGCWRMVAISLAMACSTAGSNDFVVGSILDAIAAVLGLRSVGQNLRPRDKSSVSLGSSLVLLMFITVGLVSSRFIDGVVYFRGPEIVEALMLKE